METTFKVLNLDTIWNKSWEHAKQYFLPIFAMNVIIYLSSKFISSLFYSTTQLTMALQNAAYYNDPDLFLRELTPAILAMMPMLPLGGLIGWLLSSYFQVALYRLLIDGVKGLKLSISERIKGAWTGYLSFLGITLVKRLIVGIGLVLCLLPGIFLAVRLMFVPIIAANKPKLTLGEVFSESWNLTRNHFWTLLGYGIVAILVNIVGLLCCCVGIVFTAVVTQFMLANVYATLTDIQDIQPTTDEEQEIPYGEAYSHE